MEAQLNIIYLNRAKTVFRYHTTNCMTELYHLQMESLAISREGNRYK